jgi:O-antigen biosynthesis rhamnosyltransferase
MRVLHFFKTYYPDTFGGIEQVICQLCRSSERYGVTSEVLTLSRDPGADSIYWDNHQVHRTQINFSFASMGISFDSFHRFLKLAQQADIIHYHYPWPFMDVVHFATRLKKPAVVTYHSDIVRQKILLRFYKPLQHLFLQSVDRIVATSANYVETSEVLKQYAEKTTVIPIGIDKASYPEPSLAMLRKLKSLVGDRFFLFVGGLRYYKGLHVLLDAAEGTDFPVVIVGSGPLEEELKGHAIRRGLHHVRFLGALPDEEKVALQQLCYAVVFPSNERSEAFGISLLEGAMFGKPLISCEIGTGTSYINIDGKTGLVVAPNDPMALRAAMSYLWDNPTVASQMGRQSEDRYRAFFTADQMMVNYTDLYHKLLSSRS